jgi:hypothetical protein
VIIHLSAFSHARLCVIYRERSSRPLSVFSHLGFGGVALWEFLMTYILGIYLLLDNQFVNILSHSTNHLLVLLAAALDAQGLDV